MKLLPLTPEITIRLVLLIISIKLVLSSLESLYNYNIYRPNQLLSWKYIKKTRKIFTLKKISISGFDTIFSFQGTLILTTIQLILTLLMVFNLLFNKPVGVLVLLITFLGILLGMRNTYSNNGSDQLSNIIMLAVCLSMAPGASDLTRYLSIIFIAFQIELSYLTSGVYKLINIDWRNGECLKGVLSTAQFGNIYLKRWLDSNPVTYILSSFMIIFGEILLSLSFLFPPELCLLMLLSGVGFHLFVAFVMGFNTFLWSFSAAYPCIYFISIHWQRYSISHF